MHRLKIFFYLIIFINSFSFSSYAFQNEAEELIKNMTQNAKKIISDKNLSLEIKKKEVEQIALANVDVDGLGRYTLGNNLNKLSKEQLEQYKKIFRVFFSKNISSRLQNYNDKKIYVTGSKKISDNYVLVNSKMVSDKDNQEIKVEWRVFSVNNKLIVRDLVVEDISLAKTQREEFASIFASKGFDGLILTLKEFIAKN